MPRADPPAPADMSAASSTWERLVELAEALGDPPEPADVSAASSAFVRFLDSLETGDPPAQSDVLARSPALLHFIGLLVTGDDPPPGLACFVEWYVVILGDPPAQSDVLAASTTLFPADRDFACDLVRWVEDLLAVRIRDALPSEALSLALLGRTWPEGSEALRDAFAYLQEGADQWRRARATLDRHPPEGGEAHAFLLRAGTVRHKSDGVTGLGWRETGEAVGRGLAAWCRVQECGKAVLVALREAGRGDETPPTVADFAPRGELEERVLDALTAVDGSVYTSSRELAEWIQKVHGEADERSIRGAIKRMRDRGAPIDTVPGVGSRIPPGRARATLPPAWRS